MSIRLDIIHFYPPFSSSVAAYSNEQAANLTLRITSCNTAVMSDDEERVTMPFKFVTGM